MASRTVFALTLVSLCAACGRNWVYDASGAAHDESGTSVGSSSGGSSGGAATTCGRDSPIEGCGGGSCPGNCSCGGPFCESGTWVCYMNCSTSSSDGYRGTTTRTSTAGTSTGGTTGGGSSSSAASGGSSGGSTSGACPGSLEDCFGVCTDTQSDIANCGTCGHACFVSYPLCCDGSCTDMQTDPSNCGTCGNACLLWDVCYEGYCNSGATCGGQQTACRSICCNADQICDPSTNEGACIDAADGG